MVPGRGMSLAPRGPTLSLGCTMQVVHGAFQLLGAILGSQGPSLGMRIIPGASLLGDHARALGFMMPPGWEQSWDRGAHQRCLPAWGPPWGLMVHP